MRIWNNKNSVFSAILQLIQSQNRYFSCLQSASSISEDIKIALHCKNIQDNFIVQSFGTIQKAKKVTKPMGLHTENSFLGLTEYGYQVRVVSIRHLPELKDEIVGRFKEGLFNEEFFRLRLAFFDFNAPQSLPNAKSIIVVAVSRPQAQATFIYEGKKKALILPPTYVAYQQTTNHVGELLDGIVKEEEFKTARTALPLKLLAVRSGLAEYGRNNITYVPGMGSFHQIVAFYSDMPCIEEIWRESQVMKSCEKCQACQRACPTHAISSDRFLLRAERCISYLNEMKGNIPFPSWLDPSWHNCLYGCMHCQRVCPVDKPFLNRVAEKEEFSQEETELLLRGQSSNNLPSSTIEKLKNLDLIDPDSLDSLPRNLSVFMGSASTANAWQPPDKP